MKTFVVIPTQFKSRETLVSLLETFEVDKAVYRVYLMDNTGREDDLENPLVWKFSKTVPLPSSNMTIYEMWNRAWEYIRYNYFKDELNIAFLNDDIMIRPDPLNSEYMGIMAEFLRADSSVAAVYPDYMSEWNSSGLYTMQYTESTFGHGGMAGFCFMLKGELDIPYIDEKLKLYWGDDDLVKQIAIKGYNIGRIVGLPIQHIGSVTINQMDRTERYRIMEEDRQYFNQKYGENREPVW